MITMPNKALQGTRRKGRASELHKGGIWLQRQVVQSTLMPASLMNAP